MTDFRAGSGECPEHPELERLRAENARLKDQLQRVSADLQDARSAVVRGGAEKKGLDEEDLEDALEADVSGEALRKRLWRLCKADSRGRRFYIN